MLKTAFPWHIVLSFEIFIHLNDFTFEVGGAFVLSTTTFKRHSKTVGIYKV